MGSATLKKINFIYFWLCWIFVTARASHCGGSSNCGVQASGTQAQWFGSRALE